MSKDCVLPYYTSHSYRSVAVLNTSMGDLQRQLYKGGEYDMFKYAPMFESDFIQVSRRGEVTDVHNSVQMVTVGITSTSPILPRPDIMLLARPAWVCEKHASYGRPTKSRRRKATKAFELTRLLPLKFVKISIHDREKQQLRLKLATGRTFYLQLCPSSDAQDLFHNWEKLVYLLRPPVECCTSTPILQTEHLMTTSVCLTDDNKRKTTAELCGETEQDQARLGKLREVSQINSSAYAGEERLQQAFHGTPRALPAALKPPGPDARAVIAEAAAGSTAGTAVLGTATGYTAGTAVSGMAAGPTAETAVAETAAGPAAGEAVETMASGPTTGTALEGTGPTTGTAMEESAVGPTAGTAVVGMAAGPTAGMEVASALGISSTKSSGPGQVSVALARMVTKGPGEGGSSKAIAGAADMSSDGVNVLLGVSKSSAVSVIATSPSPESNRSVAFAEVATISKTVTESAEGPFTSTLKPKGYMNEGDRSQKLSQLSTEASKENNEGKAKEKIVTKKSSHLLRIGREKSAGNLSSHQPLDSRGTMTEDEKEKGHSILKGKAQKSSLHKSVSGSLTQKESRGTTHKLVWTQSASSSASISKISSRISSFFRNLRATPTSKAEIISHNRGVDIVDKTTKRPDIETTMEKTQDLKIMGTMASEITETIIFEAKSI